MGENLDTLIAFVTIIIGLCMTLQLVTDTVTQFFNVRGSVYLSLIETLYVDFLDKEKQTADEKKKRKAPRIQSVGQRMRVFARQLETLWQTAQALRKDLVSLRDALATKKTDAEKLACLKESAESIFPQLRTSAERIRGLHPDLLLKTYKSLKDKVSAASASASASATAQSPAAQKAQSVVSAGLDVINDGLNSLDKITSALYEVGEKDVHKFVTKIEEGINDAVIKVSAFEAKVGSIHTRIEANLDNALDQLKNNYTKRMKLWCFGLGVAMCLLLNADSISIYRTLQKSPAQVQGIIQQQEAITASPTASDQSSELNTVSAAAKTLAEKMASAPQATGAEADTAAELAALVKEFAAFKVGFDSLRSSIDAEFATLKKDQPGIKLNGEVDLSRADTEITGAIKKAGENIDGAEKAITTLKTLNPGDTQPAVKLLNEAVGQLTTAFFQLGAWKINARINYLAASDLPLGWSGISHFPSWSAFFSALLMKVAGILLTVVLISFGAPFWNDILKLLLGVKGVVSGRADQSDKPAAGTPLKPGGGTALPAEQGTTPAPTG